MKLLKYLIIFLFLFNQNFSNAKYENLQNKITKNLRCLICQGQSVYDSDSEFANSIKILVKQKLDDGQSENQLYDYLKNKYGEWILYDPGFRKSTYFLWLLPILIFIFGGAIIFKLFIIKKKLIIVDHEII